ncbi:hypothetical protein AB4Y72_17800 [Arthrobacter sp. YAF34]|uniref:ParB family protein n=1 Tax=Arthrobacter sp. YAF34 TaxID=3233083 RepID=UPI003F9072A1
MPAAFVAAGGAEGYASVSDLSVGATMHEVKRLHVRHNAGPALLSRATLGLPEVRRRTPPF